MTFRLTTLMYLFSLVAASLAAFGPVGCIVAVMGVLMLWAGWFYLRPRGYATLFLLGLGGLFLILLLVPRVQRIPVPTPHRQCLYHLRQFGHVIINYESQHGTLPATESLTVDKHPYSWRVAVLPFMEADELYASYRFDEPWDSPSNRREVGIVQLELYQCPAHGARNSTNYFAVNGPDTVWGDGLPRSLADVTDDPANTILLIEATRNIHWTQPKDLSFDEAVKLLTTPLLTDQSDGHRIDRGYFSEPAHVRNVLMCDGSCRQLVMPLDREVAVALLTASGGEQVDVRQFEVQPIPQPAHGHPVAIGAFVLLALLPGVPKLRPLIWPSFEPEPATDQ